MHINGTGTQLTAAGIGKMTAAGASQHSPQKNDRRPHLLHQHFGDRIRTQVPHLYCHGMFLHGAPAAQVCQDPACRKYICQAGTIFQNRFAVTEQRSRQNGQGTVFCPMEKNFSLQRFAALNYQFLQTASPLFIFSVCSFDRIGEMCRQAGFLQCFPRSYLDFAF